MIFFSFFFMAALTSAAVAATDKGGGKSMVPVSSQKGLARVGPNSSGGRGKGIVPAGSRKGPSRTGPNTIGGGGSLVSSNSSQRGRGKTGPGRLISGGSRGKNGSSRAAASGAVFTRRPESGWSSSRAPAGGEPSGALYGGPRAVYQPPPDYRSYRTPYRRRGASPPESEDPIRKSENKTGFGASPPEPEEPPASSFVSREAGLEESRIRDEAMAFLQSFRRQAAREIQGDSASFPGSEEGQGGDVPLLPKPEESQGEASLLPKPEGAKGDPLLLTEPEGAKGAGGAQGDESLLPQPRGEENCRPGLFRRLLKKMGRALS